MSGSFQVGGYEWVMEVFPSGHRQDRAEHIGVFVKPIINDNDTKVTALLTFRPVYSTGQAPSFPLHVLGHMFVGKDCESYGFPDFITAEYANSRYVAHDGSFTIQCRVEVAAPSFISTTDVGVVTPVAVPPSNLTRHVERLLESKEGCDVNFLVEENEIHAHGLVIAARSPMLHEAVKSATSTNGDAKIVIDGMRASAFTAMLHFIYADELPPINDKLVLGDSGDSVTAVAGEMLAAACRFDQERMKRLCVNLLAENVTTVTSAVATVKLARHHKCPELEEYCMRYMLLPQVTATCINMFIESQMA